MNAKMMIKAGALATSLFLAASIQAGAATEIFEDQINYGPTAASMFVDGMVGKPLQLITALGGTATWIATLPFSLASDSHEVAGQKLIIEPFSELKRCLGCTSQQNQTRMFQYSDAYLKQSNYGLEPVYFEQQPNMYRYAQSENHTKIIEPWMP